MKEEVVRFIGENKPVVQMCLLTETGEDEQIVLVSKGLAKAERLLKKIVFLENEFDNTWVIDRKWSGHNGVLSFKPVVMNKWGYMYFGHGSRFLCMSATPPSKGGLCREYGIAEQFVGVSEMDSLFDRRRCPVIYRPVGRFSREHIEDSLELLGDAVYDIVKDNLDKKILVHTTNYRIMKKLADEDFGVDMEDGSYLGVPIFSHNTAGERSSALESFKFCDAPAVLVSPSFERGVDLPYELCGVQIVCKVPYLGLGDKQVKKRTEMDRGWYMEKTVNRLVQSCGRGMRAEDDNCVTFILDGCFGMLVKKEKRLFQKWFLDRICVEEKQGE
ncbi:MAG: hypothetical protein DDT42_01546 [candidate division WS2 bacterium]|uniref:ATP-dependent helicase C-terminal domain-containing protein n=1 Tax=Psychracetigena formicireducens TaxID=2986056 RepID=A0A9E2BJ11_PSYF1|nr:hypothetical protein [Candidatus Psychracetigena formicireducens]